MNVNVDTIKNISKIKNVNCDNNNNNNKNTICSKRKYVDIGDKHDSNDINDNIDGSIIEPSLKKRKICQQSNISNNNNTTTKNTKINKTITNICENKSKNAIKYCKNVNGFNES